MKTMLTQLDTAPGFCPLYGSAETLVRNRRGILVNEVTVFTAPDVTFAVADG